MADKPTGSELAQIIRRNIEEFTQAAAQVDEARADAAPGPDRWSAKEIVSHLLGPQGPGPLAMFHVYLSEDNPLIELKPGTTFLDGDRAAKSLPALVAELQAKYAAVASFAEELGPEQLARTARIPALVDSPFGGQPSLGDLLFGLGDYHIRFHADQMRKVASDTAA